MSEQNSYIARTSGLKAKDYLGYAMVDAAGCLVFSLVTTLLQKYYTDIFHLSPLFIMFMFRQSFLLLPMFSSISSLFMFP